MFDLNNQLRRYILTSAKVQIYFGMCKPRVEWERGGSVVGNGLELLMGWGSV